MTVHELVLNALVPALANTWAIELPPNPTWPAGVFNIDTVPEDQWCINGGYSQHVVSLVVLSLDLQDIETLLPLDGGGPLRTALEALNPQYMWEDSSVDADYEPDAAVYARILTVRLRTPRH